MCGGGEGGMLSSFASPARAVKRYSRQSTCGALLGCALCQRGVDARPVSSWRLFPIYASPHFTPGQVRLHDVLGHWPPRVQPVQPAWVGQRVGRLGVPQVRVVLPRAAARRGAA